ncbi:hypothetical protein ABT084_11155 [Streptomyces sp. NPDC002138]|uniref:hypothetical protein n=1 Tax=Streptomyces sp. NPDC002138 TaxID=3154410 RepID=UPI003322DC85
MTKEEEEEEGAMSLQVHFAILHCYEQEDTFGNDTPIIRWNGQETWRGELGSGDETDTNHFVLFGGSDPGIVSLTEADWPDADDHLGAHAIRMDEAGEDWHRAFFESDEAKYHLDYQVFNG